MKKFLEKLKKKQSSIPIRIVFICTANCCRSPLAEILFEKLLVEHMGSLKALKKKNIIIESAGTRYSGLTIARKSADLLIHEEYIDKNRCLTHRGRCVDEIEEPDLVLTMTGSHVSQVRSIKPGWKEKTFTLDEFVKKDFGKKGKDINDPIGGPEFGYRIMKNQVKECLGLLLVEFIEAGLV